MIPPSQLTGLPRSAASRPVRQAGKKLPRTQGRNGYARLFTQLRLKIAAFVARAQERHEHGHVQSIASHHITARLCVCSVSACWSAASGQRQSLARDCGVIAPTLLPHQNPDDNQSLLTFSTVFPSTSQKSPVVSLSSYFFFFFFLTQVAGHTGHLRSPGCPSLHLVSEQKRKK